MSLMANCETGTVLGIKKNKYKRRVLTIDKHADENREKVL